MKTITVKTLSQDGFHQKSDDETIAKYEAAAPDMVHVWEFTPKPLRNADILAIDKALVNDDSLYGKNGRGLAELSMIARAQQVLLKGLSAWNIKTETGDALPITLENVETIPTDVLLTVANQVEYPKLPSLEEVEKAKNA